MIIEGKLVAVLQVPGNTKRGIMYLNTVEDRKLKRKRRKSGRFKELGDDPAELHNQEYWKVINERNKEIQELMGKKVRITIEVVEQESCSRAICNWAEAIG